MSLQRTDTISTPSTPSPNEPGSDFRDTERAMYAALLAAVRYNIPPYDYSEPMIMGGLSGGYQMYSPFDTACEYQVLYLASTDTASAYIGKLQSFNAPTNATNIGGDPTISTPTPDRGVPGIVLTAAANATSNGPAEWLPFAQGDTLTIRLTVAASHAAWVGVLFRRRRQASGVFTEGA